MPQAVSAAFHARTNNRDLLTRVAVVIPHVVVRSVPSRLLCPHLPFASGPIG